MPCQFSSGISTVGNGVVRAAVVVQPGADGFYICVRCGIRLLVYVVSGLILWRTAAVIMRSWRCCVLVWDNLLSNITSWCIFRGNIFLAHFLFCIKESAPFGALNWINVPCSV